MSVEASTDPTPAEPGGRPWWRRLAPRLAVVALLLALDLWSKSAVFAWLLPRPPEMVPDAHGHLRYPIQGEWLAFFLSWNPGMAWGVRVLPPWLLVGGRLVAVGFLGWLLARVPRAKTALVIALVLILAGALGNLHDNLFLEPRSPGAVFGEVRDFIDVYFAFRDWHFPTFNVADSCITVGALLLLGSSFFERADGD